MKKYAATVAVLVAVLAPSSFAVGNALGPRVTKLERRVTSLSMEVRFLRDQVRATRHGLPGQPGLSQLDSRLTTVETRLRNICRYGHVVYSVVESAYRDGRYVGLTTDC